MKKEKSDLEQLLNSLIEKGRCPRWEDKIHSCRYYEEEKKFKADYTRAWIPQVLYRSIRELCSRETGLWQFVCENGMVKAIWSEIEIKNLNEWYWVVRDTDYQYWLIVNSLKDESELESFILDNIKIDVESK